MTEIAQNPELFVGAVVVVVMALAAVLATAIRSYRQRKEDEPWE